MVEPVISGGLLDVQGFLYPVLDRSVQHPSTFHVARTNTIGTVIFLSGVGLDNHLAFLCDDLYHVINTINDHYQTKC